MFPKHLGSYFLLLLSPCHYLILILGMQVNILNQIFSSTYQFQTTLNLCITICDIVVIKIIQPPLQIRFIGKIYRLSAVCDKQNKQM